MPPVVEKNDIVIETITQLQKELAALKARIDSIEASHSSLNSNYNGHIRAFHIKPNP